VLREGEEGGEVEASVVEGEQCWGEEEVG